MKNKRISLPRSKVLLTILIVGVIIVVGGLGYWLYHRSHQPTSVTTNNPDPNIPLNERAVTPNPNVGGGNTNTPIPTNTPIGVQTPHGTFVSNHSPNLSGSPAPNTEESVCNTTAGAQCTISFTKDGVTKSLSPATADDNGAAYWSWTLQQVGLTEGSWQVVAKATYNGESKSATDSLPLKVSQ